MKKKVFPLRIPEGLEELVSMSSREQHIDKSSALRQWLYKGAEQYVMRLIAEGRLSKGRAAELLDLSYWDIMDLALAYGVERNASDEQAQLNRERSMRLALAAPTLTPATHTLKCDLDWTELQRKAEEKEKLKRDAGISQ